MTTTRTRLCTAVAALPVLAVAGCGAESTSATAPDFPTKTIEIIIGFAAGGSTDVNTRALAAAAEGTCDTNIIISNQPGGSGAIALQAVRKAEPDGYTLATTPTEISALKHLGLSDVTHEDLSAIIRFIVDPHGFFVVPGSPYESMADVIAAAKGGTRISIATSGPASPYAITFEDVAKDQGVSGALVNVPFDGDASAIPAVLGGEVDLLVSNASNVVGQVESGALVPLAVAADERIESMPDAPTLKEQDIDVSGGSIYGLAAPAGTPQETIDVLSTCFGEAFESAAFQEFLDKQGSNPSYLDASDYDEYLAAEYDRYGDLLKALGLAKG